MNDAADPFAKAKVMLLDATHGIAYVEAGTGSTVVFIHGSLCDYRYWKPQLQALSANFRVIAPSLSQYYPRLPSSMRERFSWIAHVDQVGAFLGRLGSAPLHLVGHSRGACIAYQLTLKHPALVRSLTLVDPGGPNERSLRDGGLHSGDTHAVRAKAVALIAEGAIDDALKLFVDSTSRPGFWERSKPMFQNMARDNAATLAAQLSDPLPVYLERDAATLACPTLLIDGARSPAAYRDNSQALADWIPQSRRVTLAGASHGLTWSHATTFDHELTEFWMHTDTRCEAPPPIT